MKPDWQDKEYGIELYCGDCLDVMPKLDMVDCVITDPPYGIGIAKSGTVGVPVMAKLKDYGKNDWDNAPPDKAALDSIISKGKTSIIFGANYFANNLPASKCWIVWDKRIPKNFTKAQIELAWTNSTTYSRHYSVLWHGVIRSEHEFRYHPTQKPLVLMEMIVADFTKQGETIADCYMGSGTTGVAAVNLGRKFIGIEMERKYFDIAVKRISQAIIDKQGGEIFATHVPDKQGDIFQ